ncbi:Protein sodium potassium root defective 3 [Vitis vinifera]|uniref:Protein sodium potassium root defective 3 n=1 Tax=Vitis vinifera TaxID=29760 RepID=A0A438IPR0_VITVI|nr:Protein sodium potassium root defective 3 [Vitis vinifera]
MKGIDIFCASQASTAICVSMEPGSSSSSAIDQGGRAIDRHNPIIRDARRSSVKTLTTPCSSQSPINPKPYHQLHQKNRKTTGKSNDQIKKASAKNVDQYGKSSAKPLDMLRKSSAKFVDLISPPGSSRRQKAVNLDDDSPVLKPSSSSGSSDSKPSSSSGSADQVVVLRVSLHCKGCEGKLRKHISRMEGVTSFNIDFAAKKVTVVGDVTPLGVLASVSKVKSAQLWTPAMASSLPHGLARVK